MRGWGESVRRVVGRCDERVSIGCGESVMRCNERVGREHEERGWRNHRGGRVSNLSPCSLVICTDSKEKSTTLSIRFKCLIDVISRPTGWLLHTLNTQGQRSKDDGAKERERRREKR